MSWSSARSKWERERHREMVPSDMPIGALTISLPAGIKAWCSDEAYRRDIPVSWLATEILKLGIEAYELIGPPRPEKTMLDSSTRVARETEMVPGPEDEHMLGDGPRGYYRGRKRRAGGET